MIYGQNEEALAAKQTFPDGNVDRLTCCGNLKTEALRRTLSGEGKRYRFDHTLGKYVVDTNTGAVHRRDRRCARRRGGQPLEGALLLAALRREQLEHRRPAAGVLEPVRDRVRAGHARAHPSAARLDRARHLGVHRARAHPDRARSTYDQGKGERYRSLGCWPCTKSVTSDAKNVQEIIVELKSGRFANIAERSGRAQDKDDGGGLESLRRDGYM